MEYRYMGFDQDLNTRVYRFDGLAKGEAPVHFLVTADLTLFREHRIGIQDGPRLCALKLSSDIGLSDGARIELTNDDLRAHAYEREQAEVRKAELRRHVPRRQRPLEQ